MPIDKHPKKRRGSLLCSLALWNSLLLVPLLQPLHASAAQRPFTARYTANTNGGILLIGNTAMPCVPNATNCLNARNVTGGLADAASLAGGAARAGESGKRLRW
jgi:hypothetical protein